MKLSIRLRLVLILLTFVLVVGIATSLFEIAEITRVELRSTYGSADLAANLVVSQLRATLRDATDKDPMDAIRHDPRLALVIKDAENIPSMVTYVAITDTLGRAVVHSDTSQTGSVIVAQPQLRINDGLAILGQAAAILREPGFYEYSVPLLANDRDFVTVRVGVASEILRTHLRETVRDHLVRLLIQLLLAALLGFTVSWFLIYRPLRRLEDGLARMREEAGVRLPEDGRNELGGLARQINALSEQLLDERNALLSRQESLASEGDTLRQTIDAIEEGLVTLDGDRRILMTNRPALRLLDRPLSDLVGRPLDAVLGADHPLVGVVREAFGKGGGAESVRIEFQTEDGPGVFIAGCQLVGDPAAPTGGIVTLLDHERIRRIQELIDHARILSRLGQMAAGVAHEVRNPLNAMNIHLELLKGDLDGNGSARTRERLDTVQREIQRMERVIYGFLKLTRFRELNLSRIRLEPLIRDLANLVGPEARMAGVDFEVDVPRETPDIHGDEEVLRQALLNLLRNAIQASRPGSLPVKVSVISEGGVVRLLVKDHGQGIAPEVRPKVFDLFFTTRKEGTGVGLALVQQAVEMHGGTIDVQSEPEHGALFTISLPALAPA